MKKCLTAGNSMTTTAMTERNKRTWIRPRKVFRKIHKRTTDTPITRVFWSNPFKRSITCSTTGPPDKIHRFCSVYFTRRPQGCKQNFITMNLPASRGGVSIWNPEFEKPMVSRALPSGGNPRPKGRGIVELMVPLDFFSAQ